MRVADGPADTRTMAIVHGALRRDLTRARMELTTEPYPAGPQRRALGEHVGWLMRWLHGHHTGEDNGLWPLVRRRNPEASALLDSLEEDHRRVVPAMAALTAAAGTYTSATDDTSRLALLAALGDLEAVLLPHLDREVAEAMPLVAASITAQDWHDWDHEFNIKPKSVRDLGLEGHWLLDGLDPEGHRLITHLVSPVQRFLLVRGFARAYRRAARARWRPGVQARVPVSR